MEGNRLGSQETPAGAGVADASSTGRPPGAEGTLTERDLLAAQYLHLRPRPLFAAIGVTLFVLMILTLFVSFSAPLLAVVLFLIGYFSLYVPWNTRRLFREYKALSEPLSIEPRDDGVALERPHGSALLPWSHILKWRASKSLLLIYPTRRLFHLVPARFFASPDDFIAFCDILRNHVGRPR